MSYAQSPDNGKTWQQSSGSNYSLPITESTAEVVDNITPGNDLINQGWASYDPRNNAPHVAYYRADDSGNGQVFHAYLDDSSWVVEQVTDRNESLALGEPTGTVALPVARMGIVVGDNGNVYILTRDVERGSWPLLLEKDNGEWHASVLYRRNLTWSGVHIDLHRWRADRVLSFIDQQENVGNVPWSEDTLIGITDINLGNQSTVEKKGHARGHEPSDSRTGSAAQQLRNDGPTPHWVTFVSTGLSNPPLTTTSTSFEDTPTALTFTETEAPAMPATPIYAKLTARMDSNATGYARVKIQDDEGAADTIYSDLAKITNGQGIRTTDWVKVPDSFRAGFVTIQVKSSSSLMTTRMTAATLELAYQNPLPSISTISK